MGETRLSAIWARRVRPPEPPDQEGGEVLPLRRPGLWLPAFLAVYALAAVACLTAPWVFGASDALAPLAEPLRIAGRVALAGVAAAGALAWARRRPSRIVLRSEGLWMPPFARASGSLWIPYLDIRAVHPWNAWRLVGRRCLALGLRGRLPRFWSARAFADPQAVERFATLVRAGVARLPDGAARLREIERRACAAAAAQRGWPVVSLIVALVLAAVFLMEIWLGALHEDALVVALAGGPGALAGGEPFRLVTGELIHLNGAHLSVNVVGLLLVGSLFERLVGGRRFLVVLLGGALGSALASSALQDQLSLGASGAVNAAFACWVYVGVAYRDELPGNYCLPLWFISVLLGGIGLVTALEVTRPRIDHIGHAGGFAAGLVLSAIMIRGRPLATLARRPSRLATGLAVGLLALYAAGVAWGLLAIDWVAAS